MIMRAGKARTTTAALTATTLALSLCGLRSLVGSFFVPSGRLPSALSTTLAASLQYDGTTTTTLGSHQYRPCPNSRRSTRAAAATATAARRYGSGSGGRGLGPLSAHPRNAVGRATPGGGRAEEHDEEEQATSASSPAGGRLRNDHGGFVAEENGDDERVREGRTDSPERVLGGPRAIHADNNNKGGINSVADTAARHRGNGCSSAVGASTVPRNENFARSAGGAGGAGAGEIEGGGGTDRARFVRALAAMVTAPLFTRVMSGGGGGGGGGLGVLPAGAATLDRTRLGTPILTESVLLDLLPISGQSAKTLRMIQDEIEKATILRTLYRRVNPTPQGNVVEQLTVPPSVWDRVQSVAEEALEMLVENRELLEPVFREMDSAETQIRRAEYSEKVFSSTKAALMRMAQGAINRLPPAVLSAQEDALLGLGRIGELFDAGFPFSINPGDMYDSIPRLLGRATVEMTVRRDATDSKSKPKILGNVTVVVDGYSSPLTAGNFLDLALRGFYNELPIRFDNVPAEAQVGAENNETITTVVTGSYREGFVDPATGSLRRLPLEILRVEKRGNAPVYGAARNTKVFTKAPPVQTFRIPGAIAMNHPALDGNGGSSEFFWLQDQELESEGYLMKQYVEALDGRYAIFAYVVGNRKLLGRLRNGDMIEKVTVTYGEDNLIRPKSASLTELLLNGGPSDADD